MSEKSIYKNKDDLVGRVKAMPMKPLVDHYIRLQPAGKNRYKSLCPFHAEKTPSFYLNDDKGTFNCFGCGARGSVIDFIMHVEKMDFKTALHDAANFYGLKDNCAGRDREKIIPVKRETAEEERQRQQREISIARNIFKQAMPAPGTLVEGYLRETRKIPVDKLIHGIPLSIRYAPAVEYWHNGKLLGKFPAMVTAIQNNERTIVGAHITYLDPVTADKIKIQDPSSPGKLIPKKKIRGQAQGHGIRLASPAEKMIVAEGVENALTAMALHPKKLPAWSAISLGNLAGGALGVGDVMHPRFVDKKLPSVYPSLETASFNLPASVRDVFIVKDSDSRDWESAECLFERAARKFIQKGKRVHFITPPRGYDLNDVLSGGGL